MKKERVRRLHNACAAPRASPPLTHALAAHASPLTFPQVGGLVLAINGVGYLLATLKNSAALRACVPADHLARWQAMVEAALTDLRAALWAPLVDLLASDRPGGLSKVRGLGVVGEPGAGVRVLQGGAREVRTERFGRADDPPTPSLISLLPLPSTGRGQVRHRPPPSRGRGPGLPDHRGRRPAVPRARRRGRRSRGTVRGEGGTERVADASVPGRAETNNFLSHTDTHLHPPSPPSSSCPRRATSPSSSICVTRPRTCEAWWRAATFSCCATTTGAAAAAAG
jgi:hypothetical protein